jgi:hypothetical protein
MEDSYGHGAGTASVCLRQCATECPRLPRCGVDSIGQTDLLAALAPVRIAFRRRSRMVTRLSLTLALEWI